MYVAVTQRFSSRINCQIFGLLKDTISLALLNFQCSSVLASGAGFVFNESDVSSGGRRFAQPRRPVMGVLNYDAPRS
jgi:hypothetical protein